MARPSVSVVMSVYNNADCVSRALDSIRGQTLSDWELIVIDDGSEDGTGKIVDDAARLDQRVRVIHQENTGLTRALIRGCGEARGDFIARQDADDVSCPGRLEEQAALLSSDPAIGFVSCWTQFVGPANEPLWTLVRPADSELATWQLLEERQGPPAHGSVMFRLSLYELVGGYRAQFLFGQDSDLWLRMAERARIAYVPAVLYRARRELGSISGSLRPFQRRFGELGQACRAARQRGESEAPYLAEAAALTDQIVYERANGSLSRGTGSSDMAYMIGSHLAQAGDRRATEYLWRVLRHRPWHWRAWVRLVQSQLVRPRGSTIASMNED